MRINKKYIIKLPQKKNSQPVKLWGPWRSGATGYGNPALEGFCSLCWEFYTAKCKNTPGPQL